MDYRNTRKDLLSYISGGDAKLVINQFAKKKNTFPRFCFEYEVDCHEQLCGVFWANALPQKKMLLSLWGCSVI